MAADIDAAATDRQLYAVFHNLLTCLAAPSKYTPKASEDPHQLKPSQMLNFLTVKTRYKHFDKEDTPPKQSIVGRMVTRNERGQAPSENRESAPNFSRLCLERDSNRCVVSGQMDTGPWDEPGCSRNAQRANIKAGHIIPFAFASWDKLQVPSCPFTRFMLRSKLIFETGPS